VSDLALVPVLGIDAPVEDLAVPVFVPVADGDFVLGDTNRNDVADPGETFQYVYPGDINSDGIQDSNETWAAALYNLGDTDRDGVHDAGETWVGDMDQDGVVDTDERWHFQNLGDINQNNLQDNGETWQYARAGDDDMDGVEDPGETFLYRNVGDTNQNGNEDFGETFQYYNAGDTNRNGVEDPGETFQFATVFQPLASLDADNDGFNDGDTNLDGSLSVGETWKYAFTHTVTQDQIDNRVNGIPTVDPSLSHDNTAQGATNQTAPVSASASVPIVQKPHLTITKNAAVLGGVVDQAGDVIHYRINVTNDGNMTLTNLVVSDPSATGPVAGVDADNDTFNDGDLNHDGELDIGEIWKYTASHTVTQAEIDSNGGGDGFIDNEATVTTFQTATDPDPASATATVQVVQRPELSLTKAGTFNDEDEDGFADVGETIGYAVTVANTGNVTLHAVNLTDPLIASFVRGADILGNGDNIFDVNEIWSYAGSYAIDQDDIDAGNVHNQATATALGPQDQAASDDADDDTALPQNPHVTLAKAGTFNDEDEDAFADVGETIGYAFTVANTGNVTLHGVTVTDPQVTNAVRGSDIAGNGDNVLDVNEVWSYTGSYAIDQDDINAGEVFNMATAAALGPQNQPASDDANEHVGLPPAPTLSLAKTGTWVDAGESGADEGELIQFVFAVTNSGSIAFNNVVLSDPLLDGVIAGPDSGDDANTGILDPGETWIYSADYSITDVDADAGHVENEATVTALASHGVVSATAYLDVSFTV
jgi:large repetitive protein